MVRLAARVVMKVNAPRRNERDIKAEEEMNKQIKK